jgi:hypothetical protein
VRPRERKQVRKKRRYQRLKLMNRFDLIVIQVKNLKKKKQREKGMRRKCKNGTQIAEPSNLVKN